MPAIRPYEQQIPASGSIPGRAATGEDFGGAIGEAVQQFGATGVRLGAAINEDRRLAEERLLNKKKQDELLTASVEIAKGRSQWQEWMVKAQQEAPADGSGLTAKFNEEFTKYADKALEAVTLPESKLKYKAELENLRASLLDNAIRYEGTARASAQVNSVRVGFAANENSVRASPTMRLEVLDQETQMIAGLTGIGAAKRDELMIQRRQVISDAAVEGSITALMETKSAQALRNYRDHLLTSAEWKKDMSPQGYERALNHLAQTADAFARADQQAVQDLVMERVRERASGVNNGLSPAEAGGDPRLARAIPSAIEIGNARNAVRTASYTDLVTMVNGANQRLTTSGNFDADAAYAEALTKAAQERMQALKEDPAGYVLRNVPAVADAYQKMRDANFSPESVNRYKTLMRSTQQDMGAPWQTPRLIQKAEVDTIAAQLGSAAPEQVADQMEALKKQYGTMWMEVMGELHTGGKVRPEYLTLGRLDSAADAWVRVDLAEALKSDETIKKNLPEGTAKDIDGRVETAFQPYARSLAWSGAAGQTVLAGEMQSAKQLAYYYSQRGMSAGDAAKKASNALIFDRYDVADTYLAPKGQLSRAQTEAARIMRETPATAFPAAAGGDAALSEDYRRNAERSDAQRGLWVNVTDTESGKFGIEWRKSDGVQPVILNDGKRVRIFFDDLKNTPPPTTQSGRWPNGIPRTLPNQAQ